MQNEQVDKVSSRMTERIQPILAEMARDQNLTRDSISQYSQRISDQVGNVLAAEMDRNQQLNNNLQQTQAAAQDALKITHEITALYLSSVKDQGLITRLLTLPANVVKDAASLSIVSNSDRKRIEAELVGKMTDIERRLTDLQASAPAASPGPQLSSPQRPAPTTAK
jgi:ParB-like chromosome segregation protein Spo0J